MSNCAACKGNSDIELKEPNLWLLDSSASVHLTMNKDDVISYHELESDKQILIKTANGGLSVITGYGMVILSY